METTKPNDGHLAAIAALDQSRDLIVILDTAGTIVLTNAAWRTAGERRGVANAATGCGVNYLDVCERSDAVEVAAGIRGVMSGDLPHFGLHYPCPSPLEDAWYEVEVSPLGGPGVGVLVTHTDITSQVVATRPHRYGQHLDPVTMLPSSPRSVPGLANLLADVQSRGIALAAVTVAMSDLVGIESRHGRRTRDELVVKVLARIRRLLRADDVLIRASMNELTVMASVADAREAEYLRQRIEEVLVVPYVIGPDDVTVDAVVTVTSSDQFSTLDSLLYRSDKPPTPPLPGDAEPGSLDADTDGEADSDGESYRAIPHLPLMVYTLADSYLQASNESARALFGLRATGTANASVRDMADPVDLRHTVVAMSILSSGAADSYRAHRTLTTEDGPLGLSIAVRRLVVGPVAFAVVLTVPVQPDEVTLAQDEDPLSAALVAGTIDADGSVVEISSPGSLMEAELVGALGTKLTDAVHPDEGDRMETMLASMRRRGAASGVARVAHAERGWMPSQWQLFTLRRPDEPRSDSNTPVVGRNDYAFVVTASFDTNSMVDRIARLERHIRRIASEVSAADLVLTVPSAHPDVSAVLDKWSLTARQRNIVERLARGQRVASIASELFISRSTVRNHLSQAYRVLGVHSQDELLDSLRRH